MFGYVKPFTPRLLVCELETYKSVYCGVCRSLGKVCGPAIRLTLSYDFVFLALFCAAANKEKLNHETGRCGLSPFKKRMICAAGPATEYAAASAMLLMYHKAADDVKDSKGIKKILKKFALSAMKRPYRKTRTAYPRLAKQLEECMARQAQVEKDGVDDIDLAADPTGTGLSVLLAQAVPETDRQSVLAFAYMLGRWVYLIDAADDMEKDRRSKSFNPLHSAAQARSVLNLTTTETVLRYDAIPTQYHHPIVDNIIHMGLAATQEEVLTRQSKSPKKGTQKNDGSV